MGRKHNVKAGRPQRSKRERHAMSNQEMTDLLVRYERANTRDHGEVWR